MISNTAPQGAGSPGKGGSSDKVQGCRSLQHSPGGEAAHKRLDNYLDTPAVLGALLMLLLAYSQFSGRLGKPWHGAPAVLFWIIWGCFLLEFLAKVALADDKGKYVRDHKLELLSALLPVFAVLRIAESIRTTPLPPPHLAILKRRQLGKLLLISALMIFIFALLELLFEAGAKNANITTFGQALYWAATNVTTVSSQFYPVTEGGELISFLIMVYAVVVFGYLASALASALIGGDAQQAADNAVQAAQQANAVSRGAQDATTRAKQSTGVQQPASSARILAQGDGGQTLQLTPQEIETLRALLDRLSSADGPAH